MRLKEEFVPPAVDKALTLDDWIELDHAFLASREQMQPARPEAEYNALFTRVVNQVPSPIGLGSRLRMRPFSMRGPSAASIAGSTSTLAMPAMPTTAMPA